MSSTPSNIWDSGFFGSLFSNAANGVDALGRNTASNTTAFGNVIMGWIQAGRGEYPTVTIEKEDNTILIAGIVLAVAFIIGLSLLLKH